MNLKNPFVRLALIILVLIGLGSLVKWGASAVGKNEVRVSSRHTILQLDLEGVILNGKKFLKNLKKYREDSKIKAILVNINSPGGAVGPSQEIYFELKRTKEEFKKPLICVTTGIMASGAYYAAAACDKIVVAPGALVGSIGVIMQFANLEKLYDWAKVSRYTITSGKFKDSGSEYRAMREDERALFQDLISETYQQFRGTVKEGRKLSDEVLDKYADGRVFTGNKAVELGFADKVGVFEDAVRLTAEIAGLGKDFEIFEVPKPHRSLFDFATGGGDEEDSLNSLNEVDSAVAAATSTAAAKMMGVNVNVDMKTIAHELLGKKYLNQPMYLIPGYWD